MTPAASRSPRRGSPSSASTCGSCSPASRTACITGRAAQEAFLVLSGECIAIVEEQERPHARRRLPLYAARHGTRDRRARVTGPCAVLMVGTRKDPEELLYPVSEAAAQHGASVEQETSDEEAAYAGVDAQAGPARPGPLVAGASPGRNRLSADPEGRNEVSVMHELWGAETRKAVENFPVSGERVPAPVIRWLGRIKAAAARVNAELGLLDADLAERIAAAGDEVANGEHDDQFPIDVFQTGSGTSSNMNANEVIASLAGAEAHPNDHVNMGQSSNDVFPSAVHLAALGEVRAKLLPALEALERALHGEGERVRRRGQDGPHAPDGRRAGDARAGVRGLCRPDQARTPADRGRAAPGGTDPARRNRDGHRPEHPPRVRRSRARAPGPRHRPRDPAARASVRGAGQPRCAGGAVRQRSRCSRCR